MGETISDCSLSDLCDSSAVGSARIGTEGDGMEIRVDLRAYMTRLRVFRGDTPRLNPKSERSPASNLFELDVVGWSWYGRETDLFVLLLLPGLNRELVRLCRDLGEGFGFEA